MCRRSRTTGGNLSPDFRHAIRLRRTDTTGVASGFEVMDLERGRVVRTVIADVDTFVIPWPDWWLDTDRFSWFEISRRLSGGLCPYDLTSRPREAGSVTAAHSCAGPVSIAYSAIAWWEAGFEGESVVVGPRIVDVASGAIRKPTQSEWRRMRADAPRLSARGFCGLRRGGAACSLWYEGRPIWTGPDLEVVGLIELDAPFTPRGVAVHPAPRPSASQSPPSREEMAGPLLAWSEAGGYEAEAGEDGVERFHALRRVMVHDAGTGRSWRAFDYRYPPPDYVVDLHPGYADNDAAAQVQLARAGFTVWVEDGWNAGTVRYVSLEGRETTLVEHRGIRGVLLSPSGERAVVRTGPDGMEDGALLIFDLPSGRLHQRVALSDLLARFPDEWRGDGGLRWIRLDPARWNTDETAFSVVAVLSDWAGGIGYSRTGLLSFDGVFRLLPPDVNDEQALSPDFRYIARGRGNTGEYEGYYWLSLDIVDAATGRIVRSVPVGERTDGRGIVDGDREWVDNNRFAWSPGYDRYDPASPPEEAHPVELLNVRTGEIERLAPEEYFARFPGERASASCTDDDPIGLCSVLLDGEVVGRGQWAEVIGVVAID